MSEQAQASEPPPLRDIDWLRTYLGRSRQWTTTNATVFGGAKVGGEWKFTDAGIQAGLAKLAAQAAAPPAPAQRARRQSTAHRIQRQLIS